MNLILDPTSPVPLYHQIAEALAYRIATGRIKPGMQLPAVRDAAATWKINVHTVRRAYADLARRGLVEILGPRGTRTLRSSAGKPGAGQRPTRGRLGLDHFLRRVIEEGSSRYGLARHDLVGLIANWAPRQPGPCNVVHVVECSMGQCADHAEEIQVRWNVTAKPWCLSLTGEPPPGPIIATYFHYNEIRRRWPHRLHEIRFAAIHPDPGLATVLRRPQRQGKPVALTVCEFDETMAANIAADLSVLFPASRYRIEKRVISRGEAAVKAAGRSSPVLLSPRVWDSLTPEERQHPRAVRVPYLFTEEEMERLGSAFGWQARRGAYRRAAVPENAGNAAPPSAPITRQPL